MYARSAAHRTAWRKANATRLLADATATAAALAVNKAEKDEDAAWHALAAKVPEPQTPAATADDVDMAVDSDAGIATLQNAANAASRAALNARAKEEAAQLAQAKTDTLAPFRPKSVLSQPAAGAPAARVLMHALVDNPTGAT